MMKGALILLVEQIRAVEGGRDHDPARILRGASRPGLLILGASGAGKSGLALEMMARGAVLVADDRTVLRREAGGLVADAPDSLRGLIEARGVGILRARAHGPVTLALAVDLARAEPERLPPDRRIDL